MWSWRPEILIPLALVGTAFTIGWWRLSRCSANRFPPWRVPLALGGLTSIALALLSPLDRLARGLFLAHMVQHMLLMMVAPPLLLLADPLPVQVWGLPRRVRAGVGKLLGAGAPLRRALQVLTWMPVAWLVFTLTLWVWHLPAAYDAAVGDAHLHDLEHLAFFWAGVVFWWPVINPAPHVRGQIQYGARIVYLVLGAFQKAALGLLLTLSPRVLYRSYAVAPQLWGLSPLEDQAWGGFIMWGLGGAIDMLAVLVLLFKFFSVEEHEALPHGVSEPDFMAGS